MSDDIKTRPQTKEYDEGYDRTFGKDRRPVRGRWIWDEREQRLVEASEYRAAERALDAPIMVDRFYENTVSPIDGTDIGSRRKHRDYMRAHGLAPADDFKGTWAEKERERERAFRDVTHDDRSEAQKLADRKRLYQAMSEPRRR